MLKKITVFCTIILLATGTLSAQLPYSKILSLDKNELNERKFKYDKDKNRFSMSKSNNTNKTMNVLSAIGGTTADIKPHSEDYTITVQKGEAEQTAYVSVLFHDDNTYHTIQEWVAENGITPIETNSGKRQLSKFSYENYVVELAVEKVAITTTTTNTFAAAKNIDESYNVYYYTIFTGVPAASKWHAKEAEKKAKNKMKGKKQDINDLM